MSIQALGPEETITYTTSHIGANFLMRVRSASGPEKTMTYTTPKIAGMLALDSGVVITAKPRGETADPPNAGINERRISYGCYSLSLSICLSLSISLSVCLSVYVCVCLFVCLSLNEVFLAVELL